MVLRGLKTIKYDILNIYGFGFKPFQIDHFKIHIFKYKSKFKYSNTTLKHEIRSSEHFFF